MSHEIIIGKSIGNIRIGMTRQEVYGMYNDLVECKETPFGYDHEMIYDYNDDFQIFYDKDGLVEFILCMNPEKMVIYGKHLNEEITYQDLLYIAKKAHDVDEDNEGFTCDSLGFGVCFTENDNGILLIDNVQVVKKDFWKNEPR